MCNVWAIKELLNSARGKTCWGQVSKPRASREALAANGALNYTLRDMGARAEVPTLCICHLGKEEMEPVSKC